MIYFYLTCVLSLVLVFALFAVFLRMVRMHTKKNWKKPWQYFLPTVMAILVILLSAFWALPKVFDTVDLIRDQTEVITAEIKEIQFPQTFVTADGQEYHYSRLEDSIQIGKTYQIRITPRTLFATSFSLIEQ